MNLMYIRQAYFMVSCVQEVLLTTIVLINTSHMNPQCVVLFVCLHPVLPAYQNQPYPLKTSFVQQVEGTGSEKFKQGFGLKMLPRFQIQFLNLVSFAMEGRFGCVRSKCYGLPLWLASVVSGQEVLAPVSREMRSEVTDVDTRRL